MNTFFQFLFTSDLGGKKVMANRLPGSKNPAIGTFVQTERAAHKAWARLIKKSPRAAQALHVIVAHMSNENALVISQKLLAELCGCSVPTLKRALDTLEAENWIQRIRLGAGKECAYVVNSRVAWASKRDNKRFAVFNARVIADSRDQRGELESSTELRKLPTIYRDEIQIPAGDDDEEPPAQQLLFDPDLPTRND